MQHHAEKPSLSKRQREGSDPWWCRFLPRVCDSDGRRRPGSGWESGWPDRSGAGGGNWRGKNRDDENARPQTSSPTTRPSTSIPPPTPTPSTKAPPEAPAPPVVNPPPRALPPTIEPSPTTLEPSPTIKPSPTAILPPPTSPETESSASGSLQPVQVWKPEDGTRTRDGADEHATPTTTSELSSTPTQLPEQSSTTLEPAGQSGIPGANTGDGTSSKPNASRDGLPPAAVAGIIGKRRLRSLIVQHSEMHS